MSQESVTEAFTSKASTKLKIAFKTGDFATLRFTNDNGYLFVRDGRTYGTEARMRANLKSRPSTAKMVGLVSVSFGRITFREIK